MAEGLDRLAELHVAVRSKILEQLQNSLDDPSKLAASTSYVKSDGTNYGMYTKGDSSLTDIWDVVINQQTVAKNLRDIGRVIGPEAPQG